MNNVKYIARLRGYFLNRVILVNAYRILFILLLFFLQNFLSPNLSLSAKDRNSQIPVFSMKNQFNQTISNKELMNKNSVIMGCLPEDWKLCKSLGRKIYWLMQNHIYGNEENFKFVGFLVTDSLSSEKLNQLKSLLNSDKIEPLYFDLKGELKKGLKKNTMLLTTYDARGKLIRNENIQSMDDKLVKEIYNEFTIQREKVSK
jgi:hypothetical protein